MLLQEAIKSGRVGITKMPAQQLKGIVFAAEGGFQRFNIRRFDGPTSLVLGAAEGVTNALAQVLALEDQVAVFLACDTKDHRGRTTVTY